MEGLVALDWVTTTLDLYGATERGASPRRAAPHARTHHGAAGWGAPRAQALQRGGVPVSVRVTRGLEAAAACGQLRNAHQKEPLPSFTPAAWMMRRPGQPDAPAWSAAAAERLCCNCV